MEKSLIEQAKSYINEDRLEEISLKTGETRASITSGLNNIIPAVFLALQSQKDRGLNDVLDQFKSSFFDEGAKQSFTEPEEISTAYNANDSREPLLIKSLFGENSETIISTLSNFSHLKSATVKELIRVSLPAVFTSLSTKGSDLSSSSIATLLEQHKADFASAIPSSIGLAAFGTHYANLEPDIPTFTEPAEGPTKQIELDDRTVPVKEPIIDPVKDVIVNDHFPAQATQDSGQHAPVIDPVAHHKPYQHSQETVRKNSRVGYWWILIIILIVLAYVLFG